MVKRCGLVGSQRKAEGSEPSGPAKEPAGRDLVSKPIKGTRGRLGATGRRGRICGPSTGSGPLEKYLERGKMSNDTLRTNTTAALRRGQEGKAMTGREEDFHSVAQGGRETKLEPSKEEEGRDPGSTPYGKSQLNRAEETLSEAESSEESQGT